MTKCDLIKVIYIYFLFRLPMTSLSKFAICLSDQHLQHSTLMGHIASILDQNLLSIHDVRLVMKQLNDSHSFSCLFMFSGDIFSESSPLS